MIGFKWKWRRQDLIWIFIIIILIMGLFIGCLLAILFNDKSRASEYLSFAANLSSILLAVIAIVYAFFQTIQSSRQGGLMQKTLHDINLEVAQLSDIKNDILKLRENWDSNAGLMSIMSSGIDELKGEARNMIIPTETTAQDNKINEDYNKKISDLLEKFEVLEKKIETGKSNWSHNYCPTHSGIISDKNKKLFAEYMKNKNNGEKSENNK